MSAANDERIWKALADPTRRELLDLLKDGPQTTGELIEYFPVFSRCTIMKHLGILVDAKLVVVRREGRYRWNYLNAVPIQQIYERWMSPYVGTMASSMLKLKKKLEQ
ncbi:MAG: helix-turn-helix domain-containing protein [candidate division Zixibacteria bacterium]|nr:helix-turn-helix domain-containing protein [candidate division Zixibacteria bacterium]